MTKPSALTEIEDAMTFLRMELSVADLEYLHGLGNETPVSGDALMVYGPRGTLGRPPLVLGPMVPWGVKFMEPFTTPAWVSVAGRRFPWNPEQGCYEGIHVEPVDNDGNLGPTSYYEVS